MLHGSMMTKSKIRWKFPFSVLLYTFSCRHCFNTWWNLKRKLSLFPSFFLSLFSNPQKDYIVTLMINWYKTMQLSINNIILDIFTWLLPSSRGSRTEKQQKYTCSRNKMIKIKYLFLNVCLQQIDCDFRVSICCWILILSLSL